jgi:hypothetical protein
VLNLYVIVVDPSATPVTTPVVLPTVATAVLAELQVPPVVVDDSDVVVPAHSVVVPVIAAGRLLTVTPIARAQPVVSI